MTATVPETPHGPGWPPRERCTSAAPWILGAGTFIAGTESEPTPIISVTLNEVTEDVTSRTKPTVIARR